jgi:heme exporter protein B
LNFIYKSFIIFQKDLKEEFRTRYTLNTLLLFSIVILVIISFSIGPFSINNDVKCALLWIIIFFSTMSSLAHIFVREEETYTANTLKLVVEPVCIFLGKLIYNFLLLVLLEIITIPLYFILIDLHPASLVNFIVILFLGTTGLSIGATFVAAIISKASSKGALFTILSFPVLLPVLITSISGTKTTLIETQLIALSEELKILFAYDVITITASIILFDFIWKE